MASKKEPKAKKANSTKPTATEGAAAASPATTSDAGAPRRDIGEIIDTLDVSSMQKDDLMDVLMHCASALNFKNAISNPAGSLARSISNYCYTKSGGDTTVSVWSSGFKVGEMSQADAKAQGIPPCGG